MELKSLYAKNVATISRTATAEDAARSMHDRHVGALIVVEATDDRIPVGIVTDRDIVFAVVARGLAPGSVRVEKFMSTPVLNVREDGSMLEALTQMSARGVRRAPVVDHHGHLKGVVSIDDFLPVLVHELEKIAMLTRREQTDELREVKGSFHDEFAA